GNGTVFAAVCRKAISVDRHLYRCLVSQSTASGLTVECICISRQIAPSAIDRNNDLRKGIFIKGDHLFLFSLWLMTDGVDDELGIDTSPCLHPKISGRQIRCVPFDP